MFSYHRMCSLKQISVHDFLLVNSVCKQIELSFNNLGPRGATAIANALRDNRSIAELRMSSCQIGDDGALELADVIRISETLQVGLGFRV